ncbi:hypothetical protein Scep_028781 [Stephania cephalantha]|uniref:Uncharacterized protein n=1 Tax=Stephania cephalantha TaxID=152367 RepID=A0AAP0HJX8_9MAGN
MTFTNPSQEINGVQNEDVLHPNARFVGLKKEHKKHKRKEVKNNKGCKMQLETLHLEKEISCKGSAGTSSNKKSLKVPFCPKEIKRMLQSEGLQLKNAQSHTIRKIIVFASLGIRHGCEDIYELDFNHFKILHKGEPYLSAKNPGEHVLYEYPGVRQKIFYPNRQNPTLCPIQILEEEKAMRPPDDSCPSYLFLCIKYGGRTRNLPQNEYVRQRMGRNKLKSFGPLLCRIAKLVRIRSGSFFFKALGITLLFMAGFSGDLVQRETKYRNLDLLQKYYRSDEEAEGEELFHSDSTLIDNASPNSKPLTGSAKKLIGKRQAGSAAKTRNPPISSGSPSVPSTARPPSQPSQFGLTGYPSLQSNALIGFHSSPPPSAADTAVSNVPNSISIPSLPYHIGHNTTLLHHAANAIVPMAYWPHPNAFPPFPCTVSYGYRSFPHSGNCVSFRPPQPYNYGYSSFTPRPVADVAKKDLEDADSESHDGSSSSAAPKERVIHEQVVCNELV